MPTITLTDAEARNLLTYGQPQWFRERLRGDDEPDVGLCITCGENWCVDTRCTQCKRNLEEDRLNREIGQ